MDDKAWNVDVQVHRRILAFLNAARTPEELMAPPVNEVLLVDELMMEADERLHHDEAAHDEVRNSHGHPGAKTKPRRKPLFERELAKRVLQARDDYNPLYGFRHISQLKQIAGINHSLIETLIRLFSPRYRGRWEVLYADAN